LDLQSNGKYINM